MSLNNVSAHNLAQMTDSAYAQSSFHSLLHVTNMGLTMQRWDFSQPRIEINRDMHLAQPFIEINDKASGIHPENRNIYYGAFSLQHPCILTGLTHGQSLPANKQTPTQPEKRSKCTSFWS
jgi:hypothetical protein